MENYDSLYQQRRFVECENACRSLLLANPKNTQVRHTLILTLEALGKVSVAIGECEALFALVSKKEDKINVSEHQGKLAASVKDYVTAIQSYQRSLEMDKKRYRTWIALGACQYEINDYSGCAESILKGLADASLDDTVYCEAIYFLTESNRSYKFSDLQRISPRIKKPISSAQYYFTVGNLLERQKNYEKALASYDEANRLLRLRKPYNAQQEIQTVNRYIKVFDQSAIKKALRKFEDEHPIPIFIVGMPRTGSSLLEQMLGRHTKISPQGEVKWLPESFVEHLGNVSTETEFKDRCSSEEFILSVREQYFQKLKDIDTPYFTDKLPGNFAFLFLVKLAFPEAVVIRTSRNKLSNIWSCYKTPLWNGHSYSHSLPEAAAYFDLVESAVIRWREVFEDRFVEVVYEEFVENPSGGIRQILNKLGLELEQSCIDNTSSVRIVRTASKNQVSQPVYQHANDSSLNFEHLIRDRIPDTAWVS